MKYMATKEQIRLEIKSLRKNMLSGEVTEKSEKAVEQFLKSEIYKNSKTIMLYVAIGNETDTAKLISSAMAEGKKTVFPVTDAESGIITPYFARTDTVFKKGAFSVEEPQQTRIADISTIDTVVVPGIAFDRKGARIGFGKGCYDMFLQNSSAVKVGLCYEFQLLEKNFSESHDIKMDYIVTENELLKCR